MAKLGVSSDRVFLDLQNRVRGLVAEFRSKKFVAERTSSPSLILRQGLKALLLDARASLQLTQFREFLSWLDQQLNGQLADFTRFPIGYEHLSGVHALAESVSLERELLWITEQLRNQRERINAFRESARDIEVLVLCGAAEPAIDALQILDRALGASFWSIQLRIYLEQLAGGLERQKRYTAQVRSVFKNGLLGFIAYHTSVRNEDRTTIAKFKDDVRSRIDQHKKYEAAVKTYAKHRLLAEWPKSAAGIAEVLLVEQSHSPVDLYETFVACIQEIAARDDLRDTQSVALKCIAELDEIADFRLDKSAMLMGGAVERNLETRPRKLSDALFEGRPVAAANFSRRRTYAARPDVWQVAYAGFAFAHTRRSRDREAGRINDYKQLIGRIFSKSPGEAQAQLEKLATNAGALPVAKGLQELAKQLHKSRPDDPWRPWLIGLNSPSIGIEDLPPNSPLLRRWSNIESTTELAWRSMHDKSETPAASGSAFELMGCARLIREKDFASAAVVLDHAVVQSNSEPIRVLLSALRLHAHFSLGNREDVIGIVADEGTRSEETRRLIPVRSALATYAWEDYEKTLGGLAAPVALHLLWSASETTTVGSMLRFATSRALKAIGVDRPSKLFDRAQDFPAHLLIYFLRAVCVPQVLDSIRTLKGTKAVMEERQAICAALRLLDPSRALEYETEIAEISNQLQLHEGQWIVDRTRIHVDADALVRWATRELSEDFARYSDLLPVDVGAGQNFDDVLKELASETNSPRTFTPENEADAVLVSLLHRISEEFMLNPSFGLDFYLSKRIRHQSFIGLIRGPLEFADLITTRESETGSYHRNDKWVSKFSVDAVTKEKIAAAFSRCAAHFDEKLVSAKETSFHVRSVTKPHGLLAFDLSPQLIALARALVDSEVSIQEFTRTAVALFWAALASALATIRKFISEDLKTHLIEQIDELRASVAKAAGEDPALLEFDSEIGRRSTEVQHALDEAASWFARSDIDSYKQRFTLQQVVSIALDSALKCQRAFDPIVTIETSGDVQMTASSLVFVHDVLFVALDNARAHSGLRNPKVAVKALGDVEVGTLTVEVSSECRPSSKPSRESELKELRTAIASNSFGERTRSEGRSGFLKLAAVVKQSNAGDIEFGFVDSHEFRLKVVYSLIVQAVAQEEAVDA